MAKGFDRPIKSAIFAAPPVNHDAGFVTALAAGKAVPKEFKNDVVGSELIVKDLPDGVNYWTFLKKFDKLVEQDLVDIRDCFKF